MPENASPSPSLPAGPSATAAAGHAIGPYRLLRELGRGGQGAVWLAEDHRLQRRVAIKVLRYLAHEDETARLRFLREAKVASGLDHPAICPVFDTGEHEGMPYIVMRYVEGESLSQRIATACDHQELGLSVADATMFISFTGEGAATEMEQPPSATQSRSETRSHLSTRNEQDRTLRLFEKAARALHAAHEAGVVHRDVKPGNIMVTPEDEPVLMDFGLARDETEEAATLVTETGTLLGTPAYMSPEQVRPDLGVVDRRSDVYSLAATLYECVTLRRPFDSPTRVALYEAILRDQPPNPRSLNPAVSADLKTVLDTAMEKVTDRRYQTAEAFAEELRRIRCREPIKARRAGLLLRFRRWFERNPALAASVCGLFLALLAGLIASLLFAAQASRARDEVMREKAQYERLADARRLQDLVREADEELWPPRPAKGPKMRAWLGRAFALASRLTLHRASLEELHQSFHGADAAAEAGPRSRLSAARVDAYRRLARTYPGGTDAERAPIWEEIRDLGAGMRDARALATDQLDQSVATTEDQWRHDKLEELTHTLEEFLEPDPTRATILSVCRRLALAEGLEERSLRAPAARWNHIIEAIEDAPAYRRLSAPIRPQLGLLPLGMNEQGLAEFLHLPSGEAPERDPETGAWRLTPESGIVLVLLPGGTFSMGSLEEERDRGANERVHRVTLAPFFLSKYELTIAQWQRVFGTNPSNRYAFVERTSDRPRVHPVEAVNWPECADLARRLDLLLPTEAQWEYACRAGTTTRWCWGEELEDFGRGRENVADLTLVRMTGRPAHEHAPWNDGWAVHAPVDVARPNPFGLVALHGNVSEWCRDLWIKDYPDSAELPPDGAVTQSEHTMRSYRGGNWVVDPTFSRSAARFKNVPDFKVDTLGVRLARDLR